MKKIVSFDSILAILNFFAGCLGLGDHEKLRRFRYRIRKIEFKKIYTTHSLLKEDLKSYLNSDSKNYSLKTVNNEGRPSFVCNFNETQTFDLPPGLKDSDHLWVSFSVLEPLASEYSYKDGKCKAKIAIDASVVNSRNEKISSHVIEIPLEFGNGFFLHNYGEGWVSWSHALKAGDVLKLVLTPRVIENDSTRKELPTPAHAVAIGFPQIVRAKKRPKKIINISCESLTNPYALQYYFPEESKNIDPHVFEFMEKYGAIKYSYAQGDSTLPASNAQFTGLLALQHGIGCYNPSETAPNSPVRNNSVLSAAQLLKRAGYLTFGSTIYNQLGADYGCARGFDSYINIDTVQEPVQANVEGSIISVIESCKNADSFHYAHLDWFLHGPFVDTRFSEFSGVHSVESLSIREQRVQLYFKNMNKMFRQLQTICDYIERNKEHTDFLLLITGDHGHGLGPLWDHRTDYALYEQRVRVLFIMKDFSSSHSTNCSTLNPETPINASVEIFRKSLEFAGLPLPSELASLPQYRKEFEGFSISETLLHPLDDDYCLVISDGKFKYATVRKLDYDARIAKSITWEKLFQFKGFMPDETLDVKDQYPDQFKEFQRKANILVNEGLAFNAKHPAMSLLDPAKPWSVNDPRSPSSTNRRTKKVN